MHANEPAFNIQGVPKMPRRQDIKKIMVIGSGPIIIGQAAEFDYAGHTGMQNA